MIEKIKYYQEDNLRMSNEVVTLSNKLENTKQQLKQFEDNKAKLMYQMQNLNNIISENNIIDSPFGTSTQKNEYKPETDEKTSDDKKQIVQNKLENLKQRIRSAENLNAPLIKKENKNGAGFGFKISTEIIAALVVGVGIGLIVDKYLGTKPFGLIIFFIFGAIAGFLNVYRVMRRIEKQ